MDLTKTRIQIERMLPESNADPRVARDIEEALQEVKDGGACSPLLQRMAFLLASDRLKDLVRVAGHCLDLFPNSGLSYQILKLLLESDREELETYALTIMIKHRPISDLKLRILHLHDHRHGGLIASVLPMVLERYQGEPIFRKRNDGYLEFESIFDLVVFVERFLDLPSWLYRGHADSDWLLIPNMMRDYVTSSITSATEPARIPFPQSTSDFVYWMINNDRVKQLAGGRNYDDVEALAIAQHYKFQTPLLDFSKNLRVAAFFASHPPKQSGCGVLYCINVRELNGLIGTTPSEKFAWLKGVPYLIDREFPGLRRIKAQEGVFVHSIPPKLLKDIAVTKYYFKHTNKTYVDDLIREDYIYPPYSPLESEIERYRMWYLGYQPFTFED